MMQSVLSWVCLAGVSLLLPLSAVLWLHAHGIRLVDEVMSRFRRIPKFGQILILVFVANLIVYGSTKTNQVDGTNSPTNAPSGGEGGGRAKHQCAAVAWSHAPAPGCRGRGALGIHRGGAWGRICRLADRHERELELRCSPGCRDG